MTTSSIFRHVISVLCLLGVSACAFGDRRANLSYPPAESDDEVAVVSTAQAREATRASRGMIILAAFSDRRPDKKIVGHVRNGFGIKTAEVLAQNDVREWVEKAIAWELENAGYEVTREAPEGASESAAVLSGDVVRVYCDAYFSYDGEVILQAVLTKNGEILSDRSYSGQGSVGLNWAATAESYAQSLALALQQALIQLLSEINSQEL